CARHRRRRAAVPLRDRPREHRAARRRRVPAPAGRAVMEPVVDGTLELRACPACGRQNPSDMQFCPSCGTPQTLASQLAHSPTEPPPPPPGMVEADPLIGAVIADRYQIVSLIGRGGMGVVYKAEHVRMGKLMAIKLLSGELSRDKDTVKRFRREAE